MSFTMTTLPSGFSTEMTSNSLWTDNTWITTEVASSTTILPVIVECHNCGGDHGGIILWNLPEISDVSFVIPGFPKLSKLHLPYVKIFGIQLGDCKPKTDQDTSSADSNQSQSPNNPEQPTSKSTSGPESTSISSRETSSSQSCTSPQTVSDCSIICPATGTSADATPSITSCSTSCYSTISGCSVTGTTTISTIATREPAVMSALSVCQGGLKLQQIHVLDVSPALDFQWLPS